MTKLLHVDSSILGDGSVSRQLTAAIVAKLQASQPDIEVTHRDLAADPVSHLTGAYLGAQAGAGQQQHTPEMQHDLAQGEQVLAELMAADIVVIGAPMYNFTVPSQLKAWIDRLLIAGKTFRYTETGVEGLVKGKRFIIASSRGGAYSPGKPFAPYDHQETLLSATFGFVGVRDITFVRAEGVAMGPEARAASIEGGLKEVAALAA